MITVPLWVVAAVLTVPVAAVSFYSSKWVCDLLIGRHIDKLKREYREQFGEDYATLEKP